MEIKGKPVDDQTRCVHYHSETDVMAIKFKCCSEFYPCFNCHQETVNHQAIAWPQSDWNEKAILCGRCKELMTILEYMNGGNKCIHCNGGFNPGCSNHYHLYFEMK